MRLVEVKMPKGALTDDQKAFMASWRGPEIVVVKSVAEVIDLLG